MVYFDLQDNNLDEEEHRYYCIMNLALEKPIQHIIMTISKKELFVNQIGNTIIYQK